jgi:hypothetical protein
MQVLTSSFMVLPWGEAIGAERHLAKGSERRQRHEHDLATIREIAGRDTGAPGAPAGGA